MKTFKFFPTLAICFAVFMNVCGNTAYAQTINKEAMAFTKTFQDAYN